MLLDVWDTFPRSFKPLLPQLLDNLKQMNSSYDKFKGTLYLLYGTAKESIALNSDWNTLLQVWPALVAVNYAEKPKIADLFDGWFMPLFTMHYYTVPLELSCISQHFEELFQQAKEEGFIVPRVDELNKIEQQIEDRNEKNRSAYQKLIAKLTETLESGKL